MLELWLKRRQRTCALLKCSVLQRWMVAERPWEDPGGVGMITGGSQQVSVPAGTSRFIVLKSSAVLAGSRSGTSRSTIKCEASVE